jgi:flavodoxin
MRSAADNVSNVRSMMNNDLSRRAVLFAPALLSVASAASAAETKTDDVQIAPSKILVAYFTRSGNTRVIAGTLSRDLDADLFEIRTARPYPDDYEETVEQARKERDSGVEPPLLDKVRNIRDYDTVYLGFPIWGETAPSAIRSFLRTHDLSGKTLRPFITHGGYGVGSSPVVLASHAKETRIEAPFVMEADQERRTLEQVRIWLSLVAR